MGIYPLVIKETEKILIVAPHPDDESIGTGGLLSLYSNQCDVIVMTDGRYGNTEIPPDQMRERKQRLPAVEHQRGNEKGGTTPIYIM